MEDKSQYILSSLDNALAVLNLFFENETLTAAQAAQLLGVSRTAAFRMLITLENRGFLTKNDDAAYRLGIKVFSLGQLAQSRMVLSGLIHPYLAEVSEKSGETSHLAIMDGPYNVVFIDKVLGNLYLKMDTLLGYRRWAHQTATGKTLLAWQPDDYIEKYVSSVSLSALTDHTITTEKQLKDELALIRRQGWACDNEECEIGLTCFAMPIFSYSDIPVAAISCSGPTTRMNINKERHLATLRSAVSRIAKSIK